MPAPKAPVSYRPANPSSARVAEAAKLSASAVHDPIAKGEVHAVKIGHPVRIPVSELTRLGLDVPAYLTGGQAA
mgnify:CR=1 FL=1